MKIKRLWKGTIMRYRILLKRRKKLRRNYGKAKKKLFSFFHSIGLAKTEKEKHIEIKRKLAGKSWLFAKCHKMLLRTNGALAGNNIENAKKLYLKTREL